MIRFFVWMIRGYQHLISPLLPPACRFEPSCSHYAVQALGAHGLMAGGWMSMCRVLRCNPLHPGGHDPVYKGERCGR